MQQSGTAGFWMSCIAAVAPAVDCVKWPGSGRKGQKGEGGPNFRTNFLLFSHSACCTCSHRRLVRNLHFTPVPPTPCRVLSTSPIPCQILWDKSSRRSWKHAPLNMKNMQYQLKVSFLKSTQAGATHNTHKNPAPFIDWNPITYPTTGLRFSLHFIAPPPWQGCVNICWQCAHSHTPLSPTYRWSF